MGLAPRVNVLGGSRPEAERSEGERSEGERSEGERSGWVPYRG